MDARKALVAVVAGLALAAPAAAATTPAKHGVKKHVTATFKRQGQSRQIYIYTPGPVVQTPVQSQEQFEQSYDDDLVAHGLDPVDFQPDTS
jgi:hypothetical protein